MGAFLDQQKTSYFFISAAAPINRPLQVGGSVSPGSEIRAAKVQERPGQNKSVIVKDER